MRLKRIIPIIFGLVAMLSSVAAVSAFEAHTINVKAHVENAITVGGITGESDAGPFLDQISTLFPEEFFKQHYDIALSDSFLDQNGDETIDTVGGNHTARVNTIEYEMFAECKEDPNASPPAYFRWMLGIWVGTGDQTPLPSGGPFTNFNGMTSLGDADGTTGNAATTYSNGTNDCGSKTPGSTNIVRSLGTGFLFTTQANNVSTANLGDVLGIAVDIPVFEGFYNQFTDVNPKDSGLNFPTAIIGTGDHRFFPDGVDMGIDIKVQIIDICLGQVVGTTPPVFSCIE